MMLYVVVILLGVLWYRTLFCQNKKAVQKITKKTHKFYTDLKTLDKRGLEAKQIYSRNVIAKLKKYKIFSEDFEDSIESNLRTLGENDTGTYLSLIINETFPQVKLFGIMLLVAVPISLLFKFMIPGGAGTFLQFVLIGFPLVMCVVPLLKIILIKKDLAGKVEKHVQMVEKDYYILFDHFYFYYGYDEHQSKPFSMIVSKFNYNVSPDMSMLIDSLQDDCKTSEQYALTNMQRRYRASLKLSELAAKLMACVNSKALARDNLGALKEQIKTERSIQDTKDDEKIAATFTTIMLASMIVIILSSVVGIMLQLL